MAKKKPKLDPLISKLCLLQNEFAKAGFHITARKMNLAIKAFGWEAVTKTPCNPYPKWCKTPKDFRMHERAHQKVQDMAWRELGRLPDPPV